MFKWCNKFSDVFIISIDAEKKEITYDVRDKASGKLMEPRQTVKFTVNEQSKLVHFNMREMPIDLFRYIYSIV